MFIRSVALFAFAILAVTACGQSAIEAGPGTSGDGGPPLPDGNNGWADGLPQGQDGGDEGDTPTAPTDAQPNGDGAPAPGTFGAPCGENTDCYSGWCVEGPGGYLCTEECLEECPPDYDCKSVTGKGDVVFLCMPRVKKLCSPCAGDLHCADGACLTLDGDTRCAYACETSEECPTGFQCVLDPQGEHEGSWCQPETGSCTCFVEVHGGQRTCTAENDIGTCYGIATCDQEIGWGACTAIAPSPEICDGLDNDCNGLVDDDLGEGEVCLNDVPGVGACQGITACLGPQGLSCQGPIPKEEVCDYKDNDCDDAVDEDFKAGDVYAAINHCGLCNATCGQGFANAMATSCKVTGALATCVVDSCEPGYVKLNDFQCIPNSASLCQPCESDDNCLGANAVCVTLTDGSYCAQECASDGDCPSGYTCDDVGAATSQCVPETGACSCDGTNTDLSRACSQSWTPDDPTQPAYTCTGVEACTPTGWGECELPEETCDYVDNDCDGSIDEQFKDGTGLYTAVEHCGGCGVSCLALGVPQATPDCLPLSPVPTCSYSCQGGWVDVDGLGDNGCECKPEAGDDLVGDGLDTNCDGIEGDVLEGVFVAKNGNDEADGGLESPVLTIGTGLARALAQGKRDVYVATGVYSESITLVEGVGVFGGYASDFHQRDVVLFETAILGQPPSDGQPGSVNGVGLGGPGQAAATVVDGFTIFGTNAANTAGANSYGVYLQGCGPQLMVRGNRIFGGAGGNGPAGSSGGDGNDGVDGAAGLEALDVGKFDGSGQRICVNGIDTTSGGSGGSLLCPDATSASGGKGGDGLCPVYGVAESAGEQGAGGQGVGAGQGGSAGNDMQFNTNVVCTSCNTPPDGSAYEPTFGTSGTPGSDGGLGQGCGQGAGSVADGHWDGGDGFGGATGAHGSGGGGGGAGAGVFVEGNLCLGGGANVGNCCTAHGGLGCSDAAVTSCVCAVDAWCCDVGWDVQCVNEVTTFGCGGCSGGGTDIGGHDIGGSGGGGGSGGCLGTGGGGGSAGGGSFGIFVVTTGDPDLMPVLLFNTVQPGSGGQGGSGGIGGAGGLPGSGAPGGPPVEGDGKNWCSTGGAQGGNGGRGGHGGGGGGGCGGASYGIFAWPAAGQPALTGYIDDNTFLPGGMGGQGGAGGSSLGQSGTGGLPGASGGTSF